MKKIIVIEDNREVRENLVELLTLSGYDVMEAENGKVGIKRILSSPPDLILCDVMMPELDGFGVLKILNSNSDLMPIPLMFLTAKADKADLRKGMGLGADDYITKPYDDVELLEAIEVRLKKNEKTRNKNEKDTGLKSFHNEVQAKEELLHLIENREIRRYQKRDIIYESEQFPKWLFYIKSGQVKCYPTNTQGKELITQIYVEGDFFGFLPLITSTRYHDSAVATSDTRIIMIPPDDFKALAYNNKDFAISIIKMLATHADHTERKLIEMAYSSVRKKVANALILLHEKSSEEYINMMREEIAAMAGTAKETTIRTISNFKSEGLIVIEHGKIRILDIDGLRNMPQ